MNQSRDGLEIGQSYQFRVDLENNGTRFAGVLDLNSEECTLVVYGDESAGRSTTLDWFSIDELHCRSINDTFVLLGLTGLGSHDRMLQQHPELIAHFERRYAVSQVICQRGRHRDAGRYVGFKIRSPAINQWIGITLTQHSIMLAAEKSEPISNELPSRVEIEVEIPAVGSLVVAYDLIMESSHTGFSVETHFPPAVFIFFRTPRSTSETIGAINDLESLLSFLLGYPLDAEHIQLITEETRLHNSSLYVARQLRSEVSHKRRYPFFPLGHNLRLDQLRLPSIPLDVFPTYFGLPESGRSFIKKYLRYRQLENPEERFLGFFRLLEKLCHYSEPFLPPEKLARLLTRVSPFLARHFNDKKNVGRIVKRVERLNQSKLDAAGCLRRFMVSIPKETRDRWAYGLEDLQTICKLRNDLTHANEIEPDAKDIGRMAKFIEVLLVIRLLVHIGVSVEDSASISQRLHQHSLISAK